MHTKYATSMVLIGCQLDGSSYEDNTPSFVRNIIVSTMLFASFLCWASVIRACSHLGYLVGTVEFKEKESLINGGLGGANDSSVEAGDYSEVDVDIPLEMRRLISAMLISFHLGFRFMFISIGKGMKTCLNNHIINTMLLTN